MTAINNQKFNAPVSIAPLISFRIAFGLLMLFSILRFCWRGWIWTVYIIPKFHFTYTFFEWIKPLSHIGMHIVFFLMAIAALFIALGLFYRIATVMFFITFTYVELIDVTTYLNHYYFISLVAFILIWLPANKNISLDARFGLTNRKLLVPKWTIGVLRFQLAIVYMFAGMAKLNADWLIHAQPMKTWLPANSYLSIVGKYMYEIWVAYLFSWVGAAYDLFIVFFLLNKKTRPIAYIFVLIFHIATAIFFPMIGMFPYVMIVCSLIFFSGKAHENFWNKIFPNSFAKNEISLNSISYKYKFPKLVFVVLIFYVFMQIIVPLRYLLYPGHLFWGEEGYRFSWRVMLIEKSGAAYFTVKDSVGNKRIEVSNSKFLTQLQEKMMSTQPDLIVKYAHHLAKYYKSNGMKNPEVYAEIYVALNGKPSRLFIDSTINLANETLGFSHYKWILPYK